MKCPHCGAAICQDDSIGEGETRVLYRCSKCDECFRWDKATGSAVDLDDWDQPAERIDPWNIDMYGENDMMYESVDPELFNECSQECYFWDGHDGCEHPGFNADTASGDHCSIWENEEKK